MGTAEDRLQILDLIARYTQAVDGKDPVAVANVFTEDAIFHIRFTDSERKMEGSDDLLAFGKGITNRQSGLQPRHFPTTTYFVELTPERAVTRTYVIVTRSETGKAITLSTSGVYEDEIVRTPQGWRFKARRFTGDPR